MTRFRGAFSVPEYRLVWTCSVVSESGDQLARVAIVVLVFQRTSSLSLTALLYALTYLPAIVGGPLLAGLADRHPRRDVMVGADLLRAALVAIIAVPAVPLAVAGSLIFVVGTLDVPARAARSAVLPEILDGESYTAGVSAYHITNQLTYVAGFALGGGVVGLLGPHPAFGADAATFVVSAVLLRLGARRHPPPARPGRRRSWRPSGQGRTTMVIVRDPALRRLAGLALLAGFYMAPPALAVPYVHQLGLNDSSGGVLMAATPTGCVAGVYAITRWGTPDTRRALLGPLGLLSCLPLLAAVLRPGLAPMFALMLLVGVLSGYQAIANAEFVRLSPSGQRASLVGVMAAALTGVQGMIMMLAGVLAEIVGVGRAIALLGALGAVAALPLVKAPHSAVRPEPDPAIGADAGG